MVHIFLRSSSPRHHPSAVKVPNDTVLALWDHALPLCTTCARPKHDTKQGTCTM